MPAERTRAVIHTASFLRDLTMRSVTPRVPLVVREEARRLLRHYPGPGVMSLAHTAMPQWWGPMPPAEAGAAYGERQPSGESHELVCDEALDQAFHRESASLDSLLYELAAATAPASRARAELVARLEQLRQDFATRVAPDAP